MSLQPRNVAVQIEMTEIVSSVAAQLAKDRGVDLSTLFELLLTAEYRRRGHVLPVEINPPVPRAPLEIEGVQFTSHESLTSLDRKFSKD